jgi:hypothetical protein
MANTPALVRFRVDGVPFTYDVNGRPWMYSISLAEPGAGESRYVAGNAEWRDGALVMTRALSLSTNPQGKPIDRLVLVPLSGALVAINYIGPDDPHDDEPVQPGTPEEPWHRGCTGCWRTVWHAS